MNKNLFLQISLVPLSLFLFVLVFVDASVLDISKAIFIFLFFISIGLCIIIFFESIISHPSPHIPQETTKKLIGEDILFLPNVSIISTPENKKMQEVVLDKDEINENNISEETEMDEDIKYNGQIKKEELINEPPEIIAKVIKGWYQDDQ